MTSTLNPAAQEWTPPSSSSSVREEAASASAPSTPHSVSLHAQPFVPWPHQEFVPYHLHSVAHDPYSQGQFYPQAPPPHQEWPATTYFFTGDQSTNQSGVSYDPINPQDPFARQMRQVENLKAGGYYPSWGVKSSSNDEGKRGIWSGSGEPPEWGAAWPSDEGTLAAGASKTKHKKKGRKFKGKAFEGTSVDGQTLEHHAFESDAYKGKLSEGKKYKGKKEFAGWMSKETWDELGMKGQWKTKEEWDCSQKRWIQRREREAEKARKDSAARTSEVEEDGDVDVGEEKEGVDE